MKKLLATTLVTLLAACSDEPAANNAAGLAACALIGERCHAYESVSLVAADCHRYGHANNTAMCLARQSECLAACPVVTDAGATDAGGGGTDAGPTDAGRADAGTQCQQIGTLCHSTATTLGEQCHELGHHNDAAMCAARYDECIAECSGRDGGR